MAERCIVVGAGGIAGAWFPPLLAEQVEIGAVVDLRLEAAQERIREHKLQAEACADLSQALRRVRPDFIVDLTTPEAHCRVTCEALEAGCHVLGEKPMACSMEEARLMVQTAQRTGKLYMVSQNRRWHRWHEAVRRAVAEGAIGAVTTVNCDFYLGPHMGGFRDEMDHPLLLDMAIHHFDMARFMAGSDPVAVYAMAFNPKGSWYRGDVAATCVFEMSDGAVFTYRGSWCAEGFPTSWEGSWRIVGERGTIVDELDRPPQAQVVAGDTGFMRPTREFSLAGPQMEAEQQRGALREMLRFLRTGQAPQTECRDNIKSLAMVFGAIESARRQARLPIERG